MTEEKKEESLKLGGNIELSGFKEIDPRSMIIVKKIVGNYVRKFSDHYKGFKGIKLHLKTISKKQGTEQYELKGNLELESKALSSEATGRNLFVVVDGLFKKLEKELTKL